MRCGVTVGCSLISVNGVSITTHQQAIRLLEACKDEGGPFAGPFEIIIRPQADASPSRVVQSL